MAKKKAKKSAKTNAVSTFVKPKGAGLPTVKVDLFAIMLDRFLSVHSDHFPITAQANSVAELQLIGQHSGSYLLLPRTSWSANLRQNKDLINASNGQLDPGGIYQLARQQ